MHTKKNTAGTQEGLSSADADSDRHLNAADTLRRVIQDDRLPDYPIEFFEAHVSAGGEVTYRVRAPRAEELEGGYLPG